MIFLAHEVGQTNLKQRDLIYEYFGNYEFTLSEENQNNNTELNNEIKQIDFYYPMQKSKNRSKNTVKRVIDNYSFLCYYDSKEKLGYMPSLLLGR